MSEKDAKADIKAGLPLLTPANRSRAERIGHSFGLDVISSHRAAFDKARHSRVRQMLLLAYNFAEVKFWQEWRAEAAGMYAPRQAAVVAVQPAEPLQLDLFGAAEMFGGAA